MSTKKKNICKECGRYDVDCPIEPMIDVYKCSEFRDKRTYGKVKVKEKSL